MNCQKHPNLNSIVQIMNDIHVTRNIVDILWSNVVYALVLPIHHSRDFDCAIPVLIQMRLSLLEKNRFISLVRVVKVLPDVSCLTDRFQAHTANDSAF